MNKSVIGLALLFTAASFAAKTPDLTPKNVFTASSKKTNQFIKEGLVTGGDRAINDVIVLDIRHADQKGFERLVLDLEGNYQGEAAAVERPPYYQVALSEDRTRATYTVWGSPKLGFDANRVHRKFKKSKLVKKVELFPILEKDRWEFSLHFKKPVAIEVFELKNPVRVILDIKRNKLRTKKSGNTNEVKGKNKG